MSDYEYSDSFISDEDDAPRATKSTGGRNTRKYKPGKYTLRVIRRQNMGNWNTSQINMTVCVQET